MRRRILFFLPILALALVAGWNIAALGSTVVMGMSPDPSWDSVTAVAESIALALLLALALEHIIRNRPADGRTFVAAFLAGWFYIHVQLLMVVGGKAARPLRDGIVAGSEAAILALLLLFLWARSQHVPATS